MENLQRKCLFKIWKNVCLCKSRNNINVCAKSDDARVTAEKLTIRGIRSYLKKENLPCLIHKPSTKISLEKLEKIELMLKAHNFQQLNLKYRDEISKQENQHENYQNCLTALRQLICACHHLKEDKSKLTKETDHFKELITTLKNDLIHQQEDLSNFIEYFSNLEFKKDIIPHSNHIVEKYTNSLNISENQMYNKNNTKLLSRPNEGRRPENGQYSEKNVYLIAATNDCLIKNNNLSSSNVCTLGENNKQLKQEFQTNESRNEEIENENDILKQKVKKYKEFCRKLKNNLLGVNEDFLVWEKEKNYLLTLINKMQQ